MENMNPDECFGYADFSEKFVGKMQKEARSSALWSALLLDDLACRLL